MIALGLFAILLVSRPSSYIRMHLFNLLLSHGSCLFLFALFYHASIVNILDPLKALK